MILPFVKLGTLALKTLCKPIASRLKKEAGLHPRFRQLIVDIAQTNHRFTTTMQRRIYGHATDVEIRPLNEEKAVQAAADLLGEIFVFTVAGAAIIFEVQRSARSEARKEELRKQELEAMKQREEELAIELQLIKQKLAELEHLAKGRGLSGIFSLRHAPAHEDAKPATRAHATEDSKSATPAHATKDAKTATPAH
ncbi:Optic atrophy 3-like [Macleaya cordata]|uniref:Optic atrophy 3-like n=1 Tax=Macleaya cordata TaxID=56857 RepID=A0A200PP83_MACCD|nr:Optic atrophy 3-like [Macleaya cordata]